VFFVGYVSVYLSHASSSGSFPEVFLRVFLYEAVVLPRLKHVSGIVQFVLLVPCASDVFFLFVPEYFALSPIYVSNRKFCILSGIKQSLYRPGQALRDPGSYVTRF